MAIGLNNRHIQEQIKHRWDRCENPYKIDSSGIFKYIKQKTGYLFTASIPAIFSTDDLTAETAKETALTLIVNFPGKVEMATTNTVRDKSVKWVIKKGDLLKPITLKAIISEY